MCGADVHRPYATELGRAELDVFEGRSAPVLGAWFAAQPDWWRERVEVVAMDACAPFRAAVRTWIAERGDRVG